MKLGYYLFILSAILLNACKPDEEVKLELGYDYFPVQEGKYIIYEVDSISHGSTDQNFHYQLKEVAQEYFIDDEGMAAMRLERYKRSNDSEEWQLKDVWTEKRTTTNAQRVEENLRVVNLVFPLENGRAWNGKAYQSSEQEFVMRNVHKPYSTEVLDFDSTLKVVQKNVVSLIREQIAFEVYAKGVGLVHKKIVDISTQSGISTGTTVEMKATEYGFN